MVGETDSQEEFSELKEVGHLFDLLLVLVELFFEIDFFLPIYGVSHGLSSFGLD